MQRLTISFELAEIRGILPESSDLFYFHLVSLNGNFCAYKSLCSLLLKEEDKAEVNLVAVRLVGTIGPVHSAELLENFLELFVLDAGRNVL